GFQLLRELCTALILGQFWSLRGARRRGNLVAYQCVIRLLRFARNDNTESFAKVSKNRHAGLYPASRSAEVARKTGFRRSPE
ncbi:MAG: hypothetical protein L6247_05850, partial [Desulfobacteraceae bacterium]|nr:hypothetical protein [Desulfobacteraceae bacterium]